MSSGSGGAEQPRRRGRPGRAARAPAQPRGSEQRIVEAELARTVMLLETIARVEKDVASTMRAIAGAGEGAVAERRLQLAEQAIEGAHAAIERSEHLQRQARRWQEQIEVVRLQHALDRAGGLLTELAAAEQDIADILTSLASENGSELAAQRRQLARQAVAGAQRARDRAQALRSLAAASAARLPPE